MRISESFTGGVPKRFDLAGGFFFIEATGGGSIDVAFYRAGHLLLDELLNATADYGIEPRGGFDAVEITCSQDTTPSFLITSGPIWSPVATGTGALTNTQLRASPVPVSGPVTDAELRAVPVPISGNVGVIGTVDVVDAFLLDATFTSRINTQGQKTMAGSTPVVLPSDQSAVPVSGPLTDAQLRATPAPADERPATLNINVQGAANTAATATLPAAGAGLFHYITHIFIKRVATAALAGGAVLSITTTNLGGRQWRTGNQMSITVATQEGTVLRDQEFSHPLKSAVANTASTIVCPAPGAAVSWHLSIDYFTAP